jgi:hypothetical protein
VSDVDRVNPGRFHFGTSIQLLHQMVPGPESGWMEDFEETQYIQS